MTGAEGRHLTDGALQAPLEVKTVKTGKITKVAIIATYLLVLTCTEVLRRARLHLNNLI